MTHNKTAMRSANRFDIAEFVAACKQASNKEGTKGIERLVGQAISDVDALEAGLPELTEDETLLYAGYDLTIFVLRLTPGLLYPPHNHFMPAIIGLYHGSETNFLYVEDGDKLVAAGQKRLEAPVVHCLRENAIHAVMNEGDGYSKALHVYSGNLVRKERNVWDLGNQVKHAYSDELYFGLAHEPTY